MSSVLSAFFEKFKHKKIGFIGFGISHINILVSLCKIGMDLTVFDRRNAQDIGEVVYQYQSMGINFELGEDYLNRLFEMDVIFRTPGMSYFSNVLLEAKKLGKIITSEMEVFFEICPCKIYAVTGSDGKTTTTTIISEILKKEGKVVYLGGNIGTPLLPIVDQINPSDIAVVELSSFQLLSMSKSPYIAVITNVSPNHLDVHKDMNEYTFAKKNILIHQDHFCKAVLNADDSFFDEFSRYVKGYLYSFSCKTIPITGAYLADDGYLYYVSGGKKTRLIHSSKIRIPGHHNVENCLAAISCVFEDVSVNSIIDVLSTFEGVQHRIEFVREINGVKWYNDSIATTPTRTIAGLNAFSCDLILIMGGYDKKLSFDLLAEHLVSKAKAVILLGDTADLIESSILSCSSYNSSKIKIYKVNDMDEAVKLSYYISSSGDVVSLSPACASFGMYPNFEKRGLHFKNLVNSL